MRFRLFKQVGDVGVSTGAHVGGCLFMLGYVFLIILGLLGIAALAYSLT